MNSIVPGQNLDQAFAGFLERSPDLSRFNHASMQVGLVRENVGRETLLYAKPYLMRPDPVSGEELWHVFYLSTNQYPYLLTLSDPRSFFTFTVVTITGTLTKEGLHEVMVEAILTIKKVGDVTTENGVTLVGQDVAIPVKLTFKPVSEYHYEGPVTSPFTTLDHYDGVQVEIDLRFSDPQ